MDPHVGSGKIITAPIITEDGVPIKDPLVLLEAATPDQQASLISTKNGDEADHRLTDKQTIEWKLTLHQIGLDVLRTDRSMVFYEKKENLSKLWDILAVYAWIDKEVGYCQGMSDLCSPMIVLLNDEADAFWCFERLMRRLRGNFRCTQQSVGVENQLQHLASIIQVLDPKLHDHLETLGGGDYLFAFRMFMVLFRRELSFGDSLYLWELASMPQKYPGLNVFLFKWNSLLFRCHIQIFSSILFNDTMSMFKGVENQMMWALEYDPDMFSTYEESGPATDRSAQGYKPRVKSTRQFGKYERANMKSATNGVDGPVPISVFLVASVLKENSQKLLQEARGLDDIIRILNNVNGNLDAKKACAGALKLHAKYLRKMQGKKA
ncbi:unnamed protein product [Triticum turgidum subsp. durum]|uniref:Rab-GAP TBC domain-containing protein n=1 Tax=Triticum turgidum subsp. durum TaxID=4567 RepID=A0A9R0ZQP4_TRITD|nr:unnamed protein product [Triticum turgidum subsp. durum]